MRIAAVVLVLLVRPFAPAAGQEAPAEPDPAAVTAKAIDRGLAWLAAAQAESGPWLAHVGFKRNDNYVRTATGPVEHPGITALAALAFLASGATPGEGLDGGSLARALAWLATAVDDDGMITANGTRMDSHGLGLFALALAERMHPDEARAQLVRRAAGFTAKAQNAIGGWRYAPFDPEADLVVTSGQLLALLEARDAGARVPGFVIDRALAYVLRSAENEPNIHEGQFHYQWSPLDDISRCSHALTAAGLHCLLRASLDTDEAIAEFVERRELLDLAPDGRTPRIAPIVRAVRDFPSGAPAHHYSWFYGRIHAARALAIRGGEDFERWFSRARRELLLNQRENGSWRADDLGSEYATAIATAVLALPRGHLPANPR